MKSAIEKLLNLKISIIPKMQVHLFFIFSLYHTNYNPASIDTDNPIYRIYGYIEFVHIFLLSYLEMSRRPPLLSKTAHKGGLIIFIIVPGCRHSVGHIE